MAKKVTEIEEKKIIDHPLYLAIEEKRKEFQKKYKKYKIISTVVLVILLAGITCSFLLLSRINGWLAIGVVAVILIGTFVFSSIRKKKMDALTDEYITYYYNTTCKFVYQDEISFTDIVCHAMEKITPEEFIDAGFVTNVSHIGSRNTIYGGISGLNFKSCDCVARVTNNNVTETAFLGEFYMIQLDKVLDGRIVIYMGPEANNGAGPNDLVGLDELKDIKDLPTNTRVWSNMKNAKKILTSDVVDALTAFKPNELLEDVCITIQSNACYVALSYTDKLMILPLADEFSLEPQLQHKDDVNKLALFVKSLRKAILSKTVVDAREKLEDKVVTSEAEVVDASEAPIDVKPADVTEENDEN